ncbi:hypothetical protein PSTT_07548 [Puccinia striiformis]|uniref:Uncharacterized protein n=1 Tax=Puccinia striiformis TaxID=27350 RepID=A0A2S4VG13_9BASI|nr:hypothetical protein PSTT_07548 [Puccinia striiformis]
MFGPLIAPNHHMAIHLAECLKRFGPVRSWWTFPLERLMGQVLEATSNNHLGKLEITFLKAFCCMGNLRALLASDCLPAKLEPFTSQLCPSSQSAKVSSQATNPRSRAQILPPELFSQLVKKINTTPLGDNCMYIEAASPKNSIIEFFVTPGTTAYARIDQIFKHHRVTHNMKACFDTWFVIHSLPELPPKSPNPFTKLKKYPLKLAFCSFTSQHPQLIHTSHVISHCAWICYTTGKISSPLQQDTIALVSLSQ